MKERPILFSAPMVRAILAGTKTQTRRLLKPQPANDPAKHHPIAPYDNGRGGWNWVFAATGHGTGDPFPCPYGQPGDRLWVRETFFAWGRWETRYSAKKGRDEWHFVDMTLECGKAYEYPATGGQPQPMGGARHRGGTTPTWWKRPAIHMPRAASRITLELTGVRVERLQDISDADAQAEGTPCYVCGGKLDGRSESDCHCFHRKAKTSDFRGLWESINGAESWDANPWVWVVEFKRVEAA